MAAAAIDPTSKARTIAHMNADHKADLSLYLTHFLGLPPGSAAAADPTLADMGLDRLVVHSAGRLYTVPLDPPMRSWSERRARLVALSEEASASVSGGGGGVSRKPGGATAAAAKGKGTGEDGDGDEDGSIRLDIFTPPQGLGVFTFAGVMLYLACAWLVLLTPHVRPGGRLEGTMDAVWWGPLGGAAGFRWLVRAMFVPVVACHVAEAWWLDRTRLRRHGVRRGSGLWWLWIGSCFLEGVFAWHRVDEIVARERARRK